MLLRAEEADKIQIGLIRVYDITRSDTRNRNALQLVGDEKDEGEFVRVALKVKFSCPNVVQL